MLEDIKSRLEEYNQLHLLNFYEELSVEEKEHLIDQIKSIDFSLIMRLYDGIGKQEIESEISAMSSSETNDEYDKVGLECMKNGEYAVVTMAGGQGSRLGCDGPKGTYFLEYGINKYLFDIQCDKLKHIYEISNIYTPWYIMTSCTNNEATIKFFEEHNYFDYPKDKIEFFIQEELPMIDVDGKILMDSKFNIKMGANGSGGTFSALSNSGILNNMKQNNIKWVFIGGIDNVLTPYDFPNFIGFAKKENFLSASYIIPKGYPEEKVGVFCKKNGKASVIEYIQMTPELNNFKNEKGDLVYGDAHILLNLFSIEALDIVSKKGLKYISAFKKANFIDEKGEQIIPEKENAYKFETFVFDVFPYLGDVGLLRGKREEIFAPIKNAIGVDSPETASQLYNNFYNNI